MANKYEKDLHNTYYNTNDPVGYAGAYRLINEYKADIHKNKIYNWLKSQDTYTLHKPVKRVFPRLHYNVHGIDQLWECDLIDLTSLKSYNNNVTFLLVLIDVLSKFVWIEPMKNKSNSSVVRALKNIFARSGDRKPECIQSDRGTEFIGSEVQSYLNQQNIKHRVASNPDVKAAVVERFNRTLKERMWRYFTYKHTKRYIDILQNLVNAYNNARHSSIKMTPASVTVWNSYIAKQNMDKKYKKIITKVKYSVGDLVRISKTKGTFQKGYEQNYSEEIFKIIEVLKHREPVVYRIEDLSGEIIDGIFYEQELSAVIKDIKNTVFKVNEILKSKGQCKNKQYFVSWVGYPKKFNSWVKATEIEKI